MTAREPGKFFVVLYAGVIIPVPLPDCCGFLTGFDFAAIKFPKAS